MSARRYMPAIELLTFARLRWWRQGDRTLDRMRREQRREAQAAQRYDAQELHAAITRLAGER